MVKVTRSPDAPTTPEQRSVPSTVLEKDYVVATGVLLVRFERDRASGLARLLRQNTENQGPLADAKEKYRKLIAESRDFAHAQPGSLKQADPTKYGPNAVVTDGGYVIAATGRDQAWEIYG